MGTVSFSFKENRTYKTVPITAHLVDSFYLFEENRTSKTVPVTATMASRFTAQKIAGVISQPAVKGAVGGITNKM